MAQHLRIGEISQSNIGIAAQKDLEAMQKLEAGEIEEALRVSKESFELNPNLTESNRNFIVTLYAQNTDLTQNKQVADFFCDLLAGFYPDTALRTDRDGMLKLVGQFFEQLEPPADHN